MLDRRRCLTMLTVVAFGGTVAAADAATHPIIPDPAGDARSALGSNQPLADLLSADLSTDGTTLVVTQRLAALPAANATTRSSYEVRFGVGNSGGTVVSTISPGNVNAGPYANVTNFYADGSADQIANSTLTIDRTARTVAARYPLSDINSYLQAIGQPPIGAGSVLRSPTSNTSLTQTFLGLGDARDTASASADYVVGS
jgi:hypothetical protein